MAISAAETFDLGLQKRKRKLNKCIRKNFFPGIMECPCSVSTVTEKLKNMLQSQMHWLCHRNKIDEITEEKKMLSFPLKSGPNTAMLCFTSKNMSLQFALCSNFDATSSRFYGTFLRKRKPSQNFFCYSLFAAHFFLVRVDVGT